jgi:hypothetical protein
MIILGVSAYNFMQLGGRVDFNVISFGVMYLALRDFAMDSTEE